MDDVTGEINMNKEFKTVIPYRFPLLQFLGFAGSRSSSSHVTCDG
jgi:hypothetical protein